jgi:hypothetical protein
LLCPDVLGLAGKLRRWQDQSREEAEQLILMRVLEESAAEEAKRQDKLTRK